MLTLLRLSTMTCHPVRTGTLVSYMIDMTLVARISGRGVSQISEVALRWAQLILGWVTI